MNGKVALITGAGRGIGRAVCVRLAKDGYDIVGLSRNERELAETQRLVTDAGSECLIVPTDVTDADQVDRAVSAAVDRFQRVDVAVNNAGVAPLGKVPEMPLEVFERCIAVNVCAVFYLCQDVMPIMASQGGGTIINISSMSSFDPFPGFAAYGGTKAFVNVFTKALAAEGAHDGIRAFAVAPAAVETRALRGAFPDFPAAECLDPADVADMVSALLDRRCRHASGEVITVKKRK
ncbi:MAG: SDR family oxidoreductase [Phycisphaerales bacterium]|nr:MAG: SDR family oxidoreductase [Phycisphaerales bacterium]